MEFTLFKMALFVRRMTVMKPFQSLRLMSSFPNLEFAKLETRGTEGRVGLVTLNRPKALNALCSPLIDDLIVAMRHFDADPKVGCVVLTGRGIYLLLKRET